jgi:hypothetical protein
MLLKALVIIGLVAMFAAIPISIYALMCGTRFKSMLRERRDQMAQGTQRAQSTQSDPANAWQVKHDVAADPEIQAAALKVRNSLYACIAIFALMLVCGLAISVVNKP